jgi:hypothetical protein
MNDLIFFVVPIITIAICAGVWNLVRELFTRWINNDWCKHDWGMWEAVASVTDGSAIHRQYRFCKKCNIAQRRIL